MNWRSSGGRGEGKGGRCQVSAVGGGAQHLWAGGLGGEMCSCLDTGRLVD